MLELNPDTLPRVLVNAGLHRPRAAARQREDKAFLAEQLQTPTGW